MVVTKDEAKKLWCPMVRSNSDGSNCTIIAGKIDEAYGCCIADECMMWVWHTDMKINGTCGLIMRRQGNDNSRN